MKIKFNVCSIMLCMILVFLYGCQNQSEQIYQLYTSDPDNVLNNLDNTSTETSMTEGQEAIDETQGELTIYAPFYKPNSYELIIKAFNKKYPNINVTVTGYVDSFFEFSDTTKKTSVELMSGTAGDLIDLRSLPYIQYGKNNLLENLYPYMDNDPEFYKENYYTNILEAIEYKDKLYGFPMSFYYLCARFNQTILKDNQIEAPEGDSISFKEIADIYDKIAPSNDKLILSHYWGTSILETFESNRYLDIRQSRADFNTQVYIDELNKIHSMRWPMPDELMKAMSSFTLSEFDTVAENDLCLFVTSGFYQIKSNAALFYDAPNLTMPIPISATNGDKGFEEMDQFFGITSSSKNKDLAWKFIRFCVEEKPVEFLTNKDEWFISAMPINRNNALKMLNAAFGDGKEETVHMIDRWNSERNKENVYTTWGALTEAIYEIRTEFNGGRITAEECARQIQERVEIFLKE